jgi:hypothetical protein
MKYIDTSQEYKAFGRLGLFHDKAAWKSYNYYQGKGYEDMDYNQIHAVYADAIHRPFDSHQADIAIPSIDREIDDKYRSYDYEFTDAHMFDLINKQWTVGRGKRIAHLSRSIKLTDYQKQRLHEAGIQIVVGDELFNVLARLKMRQSEPKENFEVITDNIDNTLDTGSMPTRSMLTALIPEYSKNMMDSRQDIPSLDVISYSIPELHTTTHGPHGPTNVTRITPQGGDDLPFEGLRCSERTGDIYKDRYLIQAAARARALSILRMDGPLGPLPKWLQGQGESQDTAIPVS